MCKTCKIYSYPFGSRFDKRKHKSGSKMVHPTKTQAKRDVHHVQIFLKAVVLVLSKITTKLAELKEDPQQI